MNVALAVSAERASACHSAELPGASADRALLPVAGGRAAAGTMLVLLLLPAAQGLSCTDAGRDQQRPGEEPQHDKLPCIRHTFGRGATASSSHKARPALVHVAAGGNRAVLKGLGLWVAGVDGRVLSTCQAACAAAALETIRKDELHSLRSPRA